VDVFAGAVAGLEVEFAWAEVVFGCSSLDDCTGLGVLVDGAVVFLLAAAINLGGWPGLDAWVFTASLHD